LLVPVRTHLPSVLTELSEGVLDDSVVVKGDSLLVDLSVTTLVDELADGLEVGLSAVDASARAHEDQGGWTHP
jgi:hypothetical protein